MIKLAFFLALVAYSRAGVITPVVPVAHPVVAHPVAIAHPVAVSHTSSVVHHTRPVLHAPLVHAPVVHAPLVHAAPIVPVVKHTPVIAVHH